MNHKGTTYFTLNDRQTLDLMLKKGFSKAAIADALGKCERSIYYEIGRGLCVQRTTDLIDVEVYCADVAHRKYKAFLKEKGKELKIGWRSSSWSRALPLVPPLQKSETTESILTRKSVRIQSIITSTVGTCSSF